MSARLLPIVLALALASCREGVAPFEATPFTSGTDALRRLTFGAGNESDPRWSVDGDSVYYHSDSWFDLPSPGAMLRVAASGGTATLVAPDAHTDVQVFFAHPSPAPGGERVAYLQLARVVPPADCPELTAPIPPWFPEYSVCPRHEPQLDSGVVRVRAANARGVAQADAGLSLRYPGVDPRQWRRDTTKLNQVLYPFEYDYLEYDELTSLRPSWSPDGQQLVFSNGVQLFLWRVGEATARPIPGTTDGVAPAWSPDGRRIAFVLLVRGAATTQTCICRPLPERMRLEDLIVHYRRGYAIVGRRIAVVNPDGSNLVVLGDGRDPAWAPDNRTLYFARGTREASALYRLDVDGNSAAVAVPNTDGARAPAVSPNGERLAFTRWTANGKQDIWMLRLTP